MQENYESFITNYPLFAFLTQEQARQLISFAIPVSVAAGEIIVQEDSFIDSFYIIVSGSAVVTRKMVSLEKQQILRIEELGRGSIVGLSIEGFYSHNGLRMATVKAQEPMHLLKITLDDFLEFLRQPGMKYPGLKKQCEEFLLMHFLNTHHFFPQTTSGTVYSIVKRTRNEKIPAGTQIYKQGEEPTACYYVLQGEVVLSKAENNDKTTLKADQLFGEIEVLNGQLRKESALTISDSEFLILEREIIKKFVNVNSSSLFTRLISKIWGE